MDIINDLCGSESDTSASSRAQHSAIASIKYSDLQNARAKIILESVKEKKKLIVEGQKVLRNIRKEYDDTREIYNQVEDIEARADIIISDVENDILPRLYDAGEQVSMILRKRDKERMLISCLEQLEKISSNLSMVKEQRKLGKYLQASQTIMATGQIIADFAVDADIVTSIKRELTIDKEVVLDELHQEWSRSVKWQDTDGGCSLSLAIVGGSEHGDKQVCIVSNLIHAMSNLSGGTSSVPRRVQDLCKRAYSDLLLPVITEGEVHIDIGNDAVYATCKLTKEKNSKAEGAHCIQRYMVRYQQCQQICDFLSRHLLSVCVRDGGGERVGDVFCNLVGTDLIDALFIRPLKRAIPDDSSLLPEYERLVTRAHELYDELSAGGLVPRGREGEMRELTRDVGTLFLDRKCQALLEQAQRLAAAPLLDTARITQDDITSRDVNEPNEEEGGGKTCMYEFVSCEVSGSVMSLVSVLRQTLREWCEEVSSGHDTHYTDKYLCTVRHMVDIYVTTSPVHHGTQLTELPIAAALYHNNLFYLAHELQCAGLRCGYNLGGGDRSSLVTYSDLVPAMRQQAVAALDHHRRHTRDAIVGIVRDTLRAQCGGTVSVESAAGARRALSQCCHRFTTLHNIWAAVLPPHVARSITAHVCDALCAGLIAEVVGKPDISQDEAKLYDDMCASVQETLTAIFGDHLRRHIPCLERFSELRYLLTTTLDGIVERWAGGAGPLAAVYSASEVKAMIRALFQNTDRRALALMRIV